MTLKIKKDKEGGTEKADHMKRYAKYYASGVLNYDTHSRMIPNIEFYAKQAGIPEQFIYTASDKILTERDLKYLNSWGHLGEKNLCGAYFTKASERYIERMQMIVAVVLRNMIDAKVITVQNLVKELKNGNPVDSKLVCIPNLCISKHQGGDIATWELSSVVGWLLQRQGLGYQTVVYIEDVKYIEAQYGTIIAELVSTNMYALTSTKKK